MAIMLTGTAAANAASVTVHDAATLMLSTDTGDLRVADGSHTFAATQTGFILVRQSDLTAYAPLASAPLTGTPTAPTAAINTNTTQVATTAFAVTQAASGTATQTNKTFDTAGTGNVLKINGAGVTDKTGTGKVVLNTSPAFLGNVTFGAGSSASGASGDVGIARVSAPTTGALYLGSGGVIYFDGAIFNIIGGGGSSPFFVFNTTTTPPAVAGTIYFDGTHFQGYNGSAWKQLDN